MRDEPDNYMSDPGSKSIAALIEGLTIFAKHADKGMAQKRIQAAEHDVIFYPEKPEPTSDDGKRLNALGWHWESDSGCWGFFT